MFLQHVSLDTRPLFVAPPPNTIPPVHNNCATKEVYCGCEWGSRLKELHRKMRSPDWVNPFLELSDDQIVDFLKEATANQKASDQEFE